jgi:hypothetical protein
LATWVVVVSLGSLLLLLLLLLLVLLPLPLLPLLPLLLAAAVEEGGYRKFSDNEAATTLHVLTMPSFLGARFLARTT